MRFIQTELAGAFIIEPELHEDSRGFFARTFCATEFRAHGLEDHFVQCSVSFNNRRGTVRGMHYQVAPKEEVKLVRATSGGLLDVIVDLRPNSKTHLCHVGIELTAKNRRALYVPKTFAHGFQTLEDNTEVFYQIGEFFAPEAATGLRFDDPRLGINWPLPVCCISDKDLSWPPL